MLAGSILLRVYVKSGYDANLLRGYVASFCSYKSNAKSNSNRRTRGHERVMGSAESHGPKRLRTTALPLGLSPPPGERVPYLTQGFSRVHQRDRETYRWTTRAVAVTTLVIPSLQLGTVTLARGKSCQSECPRYK